MLLLAWSLLSWSLLGLLLGTLLILLSKLLILFLDLLEVGHVLLVVSSSLQGDEELGLLALSLLPLHGDGLGLDLVEISVLISKDKICRKNIGSYLTKFSEAMTLVDTALPRAWSSIVSKNWKYFLQM